MFDKELSKKALNKYGLKFQIDCCKEECAELIVSLSHYEREKINIDNLIEELIDVQMVTENIKNIICNSNEEYIDLYHDIYMEKLERFKNRL